MWSQDDAIIKPSVTKLSFLCPDSNSKPSMSFLNNTFENVSFELANDHKNEEDIPEYVEPKEEFFDGFIDTEKEESEVEITLEVQDLERLIDSPRASDIKTEPGVPEKKENLDKSDRDQEPDKLAKKKKKTSSQKRKWPEDPADCDICGTHYTTKRSYQRHYRIVHELIFSECKQCGEKFRWRKALNLHMNEVHLGIFQTYPCDHCDKVFRDKQSMRQHMLKKHPPPSCDHCKVAFKTLDEFNEHLRKEHIEKYCV